MLVLLVSLGSSSTLHFSLAHCIVRYEGNFFAEKEVKNLNYCFSEGKGSHEAVP